MSFIFLKLKKVHASPRKPRWFKIKTFQKVPLGKTPTSSDLLILSPSDKLCTKMHLKRKSKIKKGIKAEVVEPGPSSPLGPLLSPQGRGGTPLCPADWPDPATLRPFGGSATSAPTPFILLGPGARHSFPPGIHPWTLLLSL
jgi:hypothetical protein